MVRGDCPAQFIARHVRSGRVKSFDANRLCGHQGNPTLRWTRESLGTKCSGDTTPCGMTGVTLHSHVRYKEI